ncbi:proton-conducting transporter transmembrane domain-containing protein [Ornithinimicrobium sediminis]|uniref:proton-conducting transporter transmembrane domain-containing protein n=1 Tax=Ornithinimicrobium sediminis TaxID=2904603 RepID=UPI001E47AD62|nr:proton-conducting transporter membrane subunit [Ornithinimicrobium sediminis]MCE0487990.1 formate hydrogenlyase [Ornithinimicrobium sediminis]
MSALWVVAVLAPVTTVLLLAVVGLGPREVSARGRTTLVRWAPLAVLPAGLLALAGPRAGAVDVPWLVLGTRLEVDELGRPLLLLAVLLYGVALVAVRPGRTTRAPVLSGFLLMSFVGNAGVFVAADTVTFYLCFTVMSLAAYGLVVHENTASARRAGRVYIVLAVASEMFILAGLLLVVQEGGLLVADAADVVAGSEARGVIVLLLLLGFGVKAGTVPLHVWLPLAHPAAPPAASAVLSGAMLKAGLVGWLRYLPLGEVAMPGWGATLVVLAVLGAFLAVPAGLLQADPKVALAYSSISQMGFLSVLVGVALARPDLAEACVVAAVLYAVHHGLAKGALFLGVGVWRAHGAGPARPWVLVGLGVAALAVAGAPLSSGAVAKYAAKQSVGSATVLGVDLALLLPLVGTGSTLLLARGGWLLLRGRRDERPGDLATLVAWSVLVVGGITLTWLLAGRWVPVESVPGLEPVTLWDAAWPVLLGLGLAGLGWWLSARERLPAWAAHPDGRLLPPGDLLVPEEAMVRRLLHLERRVEVAVARARQVLGRAGLFVADRSPSPTTLAATGDAGLARWQVSGAVLLAVLLLVLAVGAW